jgi:hypothetical protein
MKYKDSIKLLEYEWDLEKGVLGRYREGMYDKEGFERLICLLRAIENDDDPKIDKRFVSLVWMIPIFMSWNISRFNDDSLIKEIENQGSTIEGILENILGVF